MAEIKKIFTYKNFLPFYIIILFTADLYLIKLPLTNIFGYEYSFVNAILIVILSGIFSVFLLKRFKKNKIDKKEFRSSLLFSFIYFTIIPVLISIINSFFGIRCPLSDGFIIYIVIAGPSFLIGASLGFTAYTLFKKYILFFFFLILLSILLVPLFEFYFNPQVYFFNPVFGYLQGIIYDEAFGVGDILISYRIFNLIFFGIIFYYLYRTFLKGKIVSKPLFLAYALIVPAVFICFSPDLEYSTTVNRIKKELDGTINSPHFTIHYSTEMDEELIKDIAVHHEYYYKELSEFFQVIPDKKIISFLFENREQKARLFGTANADVAKPWLLHAYTVYANYNTTLKHEVAHCFTSAFAKGLFKVADDFNPYLIEGAAVAADPVYDENFIHYVAALAYKYDHKIDINNFFKYLSFFKQPSSSSYVFAGSFSKFLIDNFGIIKFKKLYSNINFEEIYGIEIDSLSNRYHRFIDSLSVKDQADKANFYFGRKSIFYKVCARYIAVQLSEAWSLFNNKKFTEARDLFKDIYKLGENYQALIGWAYSESELNNKEKAIDILEKNISNFKNTAYYYGIEFNLGDLYAETKNYSAADSMYSNLIYQNPNRTYYYLSHLRKSLLTEDSLINIYLEGNEINKFQIIRGINEERYNYYSIPVFIDLARSVNEQYDLFLNYFSNTIHVRDYASSYAMYKLSIYMLENLDFARARKMAGLSLRYNADPGFKFVLDKNFEKTKWFFYNGNNIINQLEFK